MPSRRSHTKSRRGCNICKQRRVKCDESGPPCGNCRIRGTTCDYLHASSASPLRRQSVPPTTSNGTPSGASHGASRVTSNGVSTDSFAASSTTPSTGPSTGPATGPTTGPSVIAPTPPIPIDPALQRPIAAETRQWTELRLMHRWSTTTYKSTATGVVQDHATWQITLPELALQHEFLLNGLFAVTAYDLASNASPTEEARSHYARVAVEYQDLAFRNYQAELRDLDSASPEAILYFSVMLVCIAMASTQFDTPGGEGASKVQNTIAHFELVRGIAAVRASQSGRIKEPESWAKIPELAELPRVPLDHGTEVAFVRLEELNKLRIASSLDDPANDGIVAMQHAQSCKKALAVLRDYFETCVTPWYRSWSLQWITKAGDDYISAIKDNDRIALLILMLWGVLLQPFGKQCWWAKDFGKALVDEISETALPEADHTTRTVLLWAQDQVRCDAHGE